jgi:hypothetical protein
MTTWRIDLDGKTTELDEVTLRTRLRGGKLTGVEMARPEGAEDWRPLHAWPVFRQEVAFAGDPETAALDRKIRGFGAHLAVWVCVVVGFSVATGMFPPWAAFWGIGLALHGLGTAPSLLRRIRRRHASQAAQAESWVSPNDTAARAEDAAEPPLTAMGAALQGLRAANRLAGAEDVERASGVELESIEAAAASLARKRVALEAALPAGGAEQLERALVAAEVRASVGGAGASDHAAEVRALAQRLTALREVSATLDRLRARERALVHEVESLRLMVLQTSAQDVGDRPNVAAQAERLAQEVRAADEVDDALGRALRGAAAQSVRA